MLDEEQEQEKDDDAFERAMMSSEYSRLQTIKRERARQRTLSECEKLDVIADALARGACGILTEQLLPCPLPQCIVGDMEVSLAEIAAQQTGHPDRQLLTIGVIGSAGKTTTSLLISALLRSASIRTAYQTDLGESDGIVQSTSNSSIPSNRELVHWLAEAKDSQCKAAVIEISETEARHGHYDAIQFDVLVICGTAAAPDDFGPSGLQCSLERLLPQMLFLSHSEFLMFSARSLVKGLFPRLLFRFLQKPENRKGKRMPG